VLAAAGLQPLDALHVACAEAGRAAYFLTCDDRLVKRYSGQIPVLNPVDYILTLR
jgi:predicted nucleic acid-binding protein